MSCTQAVHSTVRLAGWYKRTGRLVAVSLAPSYPAAFFAENPLSLISALKAIGFSVVEETASIIEEVVKMRVEAVRGDPYSLPLLSSSCPQVTALIERRFPQFKRRLTPRFSPMALHARSLKERYGSDCFVVFIGPCSHKKSEAARMTESEAGPDVVLTFSELETYFRESDIDITSYPPSEPDGVTPHWARASALLDGLSGWNKVLEALAICSFDYA